ncbi:MAG: VOC family protein [Myxococcota bacterium]|nr:VOC family protein [Myxococcota bacterium]
MIGYITLGTNDLARSARFYDALLAELGATRALEEDNFVTWISGAGGPMLGVIKPFDEEQATVGNGVMVALSVESRDQVDRLYQKAMELGAADEGLPGERQTGFYVGYFRDLDGNKLAVYITDPALLETSE